MQISRRLALRVVLAGMVAAGTTVLAAGHARAATLTSGGQAHVVLSMNAFPCPGTCGGAMIAPGTVTAVASGLDTSGHPYTAWWTQVPMTSATIGGTTACTGLPGDWLDGTGVITFSAGGGTLIDNGVTSTGAVINFGVAYVQAGTAVAGPAQETVATAAGALVGKDSLVSAPDAVGTFIPTWPGGQIPLTCYQPYPANLDTTITWGGGVA